MKTDRNLLAEISDLEAAAAAHWRQGRGLCAERLREAAATMRGELAQRQADPGARECPVMREKRIEHRKLNISTGTLSAPVRVENQVEACRTPLFGSARAAGICRSCSEGWHADGNRIAAAPLLAEGE